MQKVQKGYKVKEQQRMAVLGKVTKLTLGTRGCKAEFNSPGTWGGC